MAAVAAQQAFAPVLAAVATMQANVDRAQKGQATEYLDKFQKTVSCQWEKRTEGQPLTGVIA